jgi:hypothetical protein
MVTRSSLVRLTDSRGRLENDLITLRSKSGIKSAISYVVLSNACQADDKGLAERSGKRLNQKLGLLVTCCIALQRRRSVEHDRT